ncbi:DUF1501 domain-containing protein [Nocardioides sp.]|uniref:DUF1501 domain-containing protein n=1 Tax=Nocardioides sp. TaxID=35761 RepID=UPI003D0EEAAE
MSTQIPEQQGCCASFERAASLQRRSFLKAAALGGALTTTVFGQAVRQASFGATGTGNTLVVISLRGGIDGLGVVVPHGDPAYYTARPKLAVPAASLLGADAMFGLHPQMAPLMPWWNSGKLAAVHAVGLNVPNRSHFLAMEEIEDADPGSSERRGWVNRMIGLNATAQATEAVHINSAMTPTMLTGPAPVLSAPGLTKLKVAGTDSRAADRYRSLGTAWSQSPGALGDAARSAVQISRSYSGTLGKARQPANGAVYPSTFPGRDLGEALNDTAHLITADVGTEVVSIDFGGWDMHSGYGNLDGGEMREMVGALAAGLAAFLTDLGDRAQQVTVVTISEFGRRVRENGNRGLDHGWGNMMLVLGGGVRGGQYYGTWPSLGNGSLVDGDLSVTTDYRDVLGEVVSRRFDRSVASVFPGLSHHPLGVMA